MFGYIRPFRPELRIKEEEAYRSVYCGLCKELGKNYGVFARLTLSYDFTFLAILAMGLGQGEPSFSKVRCLANPLKQCVACRQDKITPAIAAKAMITLYYKSLDQLCDERLFTRLPVYAVFPLFQHAWKKARQTEPETERLAAEMMQKQAAAETQQAGPDQAAEPTADFLACVCESLSQDPVQRRVLHRFGYLLGRYIYLSDALDDLEKDETKKRFNPFLQSCSAEEWKRLSYVPAADSIRGTIAELAKAFELLQLNDWRPILENIVYFGLKHSLQTILQKKEKMA